MPNPQDFLNSAHRFNPLRHLSTNLGGDWKVKPFTPEGTRQPDGINSLQQIKKKQRMLTPKFDVGMTIQKLTPF